MIREETTTPSSRAGSLNQISNYNDLTNNFDFSIITSDKERNITLYKLLGKENKKELSLLEIHGKFGEDSCTKLRAFFQEKKQNECSYLFLKIFKVFLNESSGTNTLLILTEKISESLVDYLDKISSQGTNSRGGVYFLISYMFHLMDLAYELKTKKAADILMTSLYFFVKDGGFSRHQKPVKLLLLQEDIGNTSILKSRSADDSLSQVMEHNNNRLYSCKGPGISLPTQLKIVPVSFLSLVRFNLRFFFLYITFFYF